MYTSPSSLQVTTCPVAPPLPCFLCGTYEYKQQYILFLLLIVFLLSSQEKVFLCFVHCNDPNTENQREPNTCLGNIC